MFCIPAAMPWILTIMASASSSEVCSPALRKPEQKRSDSPEQGTVQRASNIQ